MIKKERRFIKKINKERLKKEIKNERRETRTIETSKIQIYYNYQIIFKREREI